jgi:hypothetical protein
MPRTSWKAPRSHTQRKEDASDNLRTTQRQTKRRRDDDHTSPDAEDAMSTRWVVPPLILDDVRIQGRDHAVRS